MNLSDMLGNIVTILPLAVLMLWACLLLLVDLIIPKQRKGLTALLAAIGLLVSMGFCLAQLGQNKTAFGGMAVLDGFAAFLQVVFLASGLFGVALSYDYLKRAGIERGEYYVLLLFSIGGMMMMSMAANLIIVFLALEWLSIPLYVLAGFARPRLDSEEAALKYFLLGAYAGGFVVYGIALVYGATGSTELAAIFQAVKAGSANLELMAVGAALILIGIGFKVSAVPFHAWTPDVYHGAPTAVTGFMSVAAKAGGFAALLRVFITAFPALALELTPILWILAALTMILGNLVAIAQTNLKRMLAYSSIAHAGYILMSVVVFGQAEIAAHATAAALFYLVAYAFTSFGAWAVVITLEKHTGEGGDSPASAGLELSDYIGMGRRYPALALAMTVFMLSFTGIPPTLGFVGKFYLFSAAIQAGQIGLAVIGVVTSLISAYYYLRIVVLMYMSEARSDTGAAPKADLWLKLTAFGSALAVIALGIFAGPLFDWAAKAVLK